MEKVCRKDAPKTSPRSPYFWLNSPKQSVHARNSFENKVF